MTKRKEKRRDISTRIARGESVMLGLVINFGITKIYWVIVKEFTMNYWVAVKKL